MRKKNDELDKILKIIQVHTGKTAEEIAATIGYSKGYLSAVLNNKTESPVRFASAKKARYKSLQKAIDIITSYLSEHSFT